MNEDQKKIKIVVLTGPTGIGKTSAAISLAEMFKGQIVSADSMQVYRYMDIGTAKPSAEEQARIPHHLIDIVDPDDDFDAGQFAKMGSDTIQRLHENEHVPFIVGGTGLYIRALLHGLFRPRTANSDVLERLNSEADAAGPEMIHSKLKQVDPEAAEKIHPNDTFRIVRALEIFETTGKPISAYQKEHGFKHELFDTLKICLDMDRTVLYDRINCRVDHMIDAGFTDEVGELLDRGYSRDLKSMQSIGYRHIAEHLEDGISIDETIDTMKRDTRRYAKRQLTWFRAEENMKWAAPDEIKELREYIRQFLKY